MDSGVDQAEHHTHREDVCSEGVVLFLFQDFRSYIFESANDFFVAAALTYYRHSKVGHLYVEVRVEQQIFRLDVPVSDI